jgi:hypothetical protein
MIPKNRFGTRAQCSPFFYFIFEIGILKLGKFLKIYVDVANYVHYNHANFYCEIPCIMSSEKNTN